MSPSLTRLIEQTQQEYQCHHQLQQLLETKLEAIRHCDVGQLETLAEQEARLVQMIRVNEQRRRESLHQLQAETPNAERQPWNASRVAEVATEPQRSQWLALVEHFRKTAENCRRLNGIIGIVTQKLIGHTEQVFSVLARAGESIGLYERPGCKAAGPSHCLLDARA